MTEERIFQPPADPHSFTEAPMEPSKWPTVIGVISIVLGSIGLLCYGCNSLSSIASPFLMSAMPEDQRAAMPQGPILYLQIGQMCASCLLSLWLLIAGIGLARKQPWSRGGHIGWALAKTLLAIISLVIGFITLPEQMKYIESQMTGGGQRQAPLQITEALMMILFVVGFIWAMVWPVFILIWFTRARVGEEVQRWADESRAMI